MTRRHMLAMLVGAAAAPAVPHIQKYAGVHLSLSNLRTIKATLPHHEDSTYAVIVHPYVLRDIKGQMRGPKKLRGGPKRPA